MFPLESEYKSFLPRNAHGIYKAACSEKPHSFFKYKQGNLEFCQLERKFRQHVLQTKTFKIEFIQSPCYITHQKYTNI